MLHSSEQALDTKGAAGGGTAHLDGGVRSLEAYLTITRLQLAASMGRASRPSLPLAENRGAAIGKRVTVADYPDGRLSIRYKGVELAYRTFDKIRQVDQSAIVDTGRLAAVLAMIRDEQLRRRPERRSGRAGAISWTPVSLQGRLSCSNIHLYGSRPDAAIAGKHGLC
jgi:hypothetical protein